MANWTLPTLTDLYANFVSYFKDRDEDAVRLNDSRVSSASNLPNYSKRWNDTTKTFQNWLSTAWGNLVMGIAGGGTGATTAADARTNLSVYSKSESDSRYTTPLTSSESDLSSNVTMTTSGTWYDGPTLSIAAGTWLVIGQMVVAKPATGTDFSVAYKLWDGVTSMAEGYYRTVTATAGEAASTTTTASAIFALGSTTTVKMSANASLASAVISQGAGPKGTRIVAVKIA